MTEGAADDEVMPLCLASSSRAHELIRNLELAHFNLCFWTLNILYSMHWMGQYLVRVN